MARLDDRLNFPRGATFSRAAYPWHAFTKNRRQPGAGHVRSFVFAKIPPRMMNTEPHADEITAAALRKRPLWRNAYWWDDQSELVLHQRHATAPCCQLWRRHDATQRARRWTCVLNDDIKCPKTIAIAPCFSFQAHRRARARYRINITTILNCY